MAVNVKYIEINSEIDTVKVAVTKEFKKEYEKLKSSVEKAKQNLGKAKQREIKADGTWLLKGFRKDIAETKALNAQQYLEYKDRKLGIKEAELEKLITQAKEIPAEQELKLRFPKIDIKNPDEVFKYKRKKGKASSRSAVGTLTLVGIAFASTIVSGGIPWIPIVLAAITAFSYIKNKRKLNKFENLEKKKIEFDENNTENRNLTFTEDMAKSPKTYVQLRPTTQNTKANRQRQTQSS